MRRNALISTMALVAGLGCGGRENGSGAGTSGDAGTPGSQDAIAPALCESTFVEAGTGSEGDGAVPLLHRAAPACCPSLRGPASSSQPYPPGVASFLAADAGGCTSDSDCKGGVNGRCFPFGGLVGPGGCSYDECFTDSNCGSGTPCLCRSSSTDNSANLCDPGGNCAVDSDCGPGGYCSPSYGCEGSTYYCHTASDTCVNDADCPSVDAGENSCPVTARCVFNPQAQSWGCSPLVCCPP